MRSGTVWFVFFVGCALTPARFETDFEELYCDRVVSCEEDGPLLAECEEALQVDVAWCALTFDPVLASSCLDALAEASCDAEAPGGWTFPAECESVESCWTYGLGSPTESGDYASLKPGVVASFLVQPDGLFWRPDGFGGLTGPMLFVGHDGGFSVIESVTGNLISEWAADSYLGAVPFGGVGEPASVLGFGPLSASLLDLSADATGWTEGDTLPSAAFDGLPYEDEPDQGGLFVDSDRGEVRFVVLDGEGWRFDEDVFLTSDVTAPVVSAWSAGPGQPVIAVTDGSPGTLLYHDRADDSAPMVAVGSLGDIPRRIRCAPPLCLATNFGSGTVSTISWDGQSKPVIEGTYAGGSGSVGVAIRRDGSSYQVVTTGFNEDTYTVVTLDEFGIVTAEVTVALDDLECNSPQYAVWEGPNILMTCEESGTIFRALPPFGVN